MNDKDNLLEILQNNGDLNDVKPKSNAQLAELQFAEWLTELKDLRAEQNDQYTFIRELMDELNDAKRLLKAAIGIIKDVDCNEDYLCDECEYRAKCDGGFSFYWRYANEAENLLSDEK